MRVSFSPPPCPIAGKGGGNNNQLRQLKGSLSAPLPGNHILDIEIIYCHNIQLDLPLSWVLLVDKRGSYGVRSCFLPELLEASAAGEELVRREKYAARPPLKEIFNSPDRDAGIHAAVMKWRYTLKEVGDYLGLHYSRVSRVAKNKT